MTLLVCALTFFVKVDNINWQTKADVEGKLVKEGESKYIVDFRDGLKKYPLVVHPETYDKVLVDKLDCVKE